MSVERPNGPPINAPAGSRDLRERAERFNAQRGEQRQHSVAPVDTGKRLATIVRSDAEELRVSWGEYEGKHFLNLRIWRKGSDGQFWPDKAKGLTVRVRELGDFAQGVAAALEEADRGGGK